jgi:hypothetical protein
MTQPPKIVPFALVSAGIGMMRMVGCLSAGSVTMLEIGIYTNNLLCLFGLYREPPP